MKKIISAWFRVDSRALGIYRILIGLVCALDIIRRWNYIDVFYSNQGIQTKSDSQIFNIFNYIGNSSFEVHIIFLIGILFSITLMLGYKTKLSHLITAIIIIGIHGQVPVVGNSGDTFLNSILIWTLFLPLGRSISLDSLINSLISFKESRVSDLNDRQNGINKPIQVYSIAYFAVLFQISAIYFLSALNRTESSSWENGSAFYKMHHLDGFITSFGYLIRDYINYPISKILTYTTLYLEYSVPFLLLIPFYKSIIRLIMIILLSIFHIMIRLSMHVGLFSQIMISTFPLLIDKKIINHIKIKLTNKYKLNKFTLFYDSDCGFCHYTVRIIKRLDVFNRIVFSDGTSDDQRPKNFNKLANQTAILFNPQNNAIWTRHKAFGKLLSLLPLGFLISWIFFIPFLSEIFGFIYDNIAKNRTKISLLFGLPACNVPQINSKNDIKTKDTKKSYKHIQKIGQLISPILIIIMLSGSIYSALIEHQIIEKLTWKNKLLIRKINRLPRMIQKWKMFENVPNTDQIIIVEANLDNGKTINPFTGKEPNLNSTDYKILMKNKSQLWRKYFEWLYNKYIKDNRNKQFKRDFQNWLLNPDNTYFQKNLNGAKIKSVEIWKVTQSSPRIDNKLYRRPITKTILGEKTKWTK